MKDIIENTTILIQGPLSMVSIDNIENYKKYCKQIVFHTWKDELECIDLLIPVDNNIKVIIEDLPRRNYKHEMFLRYKTLWHQVNGIDRGAANCDTKYLIRTRSDERYTKLLPLIEKFSKNTDGVVSSNVVWRHEIWKYHMGDHLFMAKTELIQEVYKKFLQFSNNFMTFFDVKKGKNRCACEQLLFFLFLGNGAKPVPIDTRDLGNFLVSVKGKKYTNKNINKLKELITDFALDISELEEVDGDFREILLAFLSSEKPVKTKKGNM